MGFRNLQRATKLGGGAGGVPFDIGVAVPSAALRSALYVDGAGALRVSADDGAIGASGVRLGYLLYAEHIADHVYLGHLDVNTSSVVFQLDLRQSGDVVIKSPVASGAITYIAGISGSSSHNFFVNASTNRMVLNNTGIGVFAATPVAKQTVTGSRGGNAALASFLTAMAAYGWVTDSSTA